ncbi:MAG: hypothetical protein ACI8S6_000523 [Myxococcota bacterium]|jgi:hypothetical protein
MRVLLLSLVLSGCTVLVPSFPHPATDGLAEGGALDSPALQPLTHGGVTMHPTAEPNRIMGTFYAPQATELSVEKVTLAGLSGDVIHQPGDAPLTVSIDQATGEGFHSKRKRLILLSGWGVDELGETSGGLTLTIELTVDGVPGVLTFIMPVKMIRRIAWPT